MHLLPVKLLAICIARPPEVPGMGTETVLLLAAFPSELPSQALLPYRGCDLGEVGVEE